LLFCRPLGGRHAAVVPALPEDYDPTGTPAERWEPEPPSSRASLASPNHYTPEGPPYGEYPDESGNGSGGGRHASSRRRSSRHEREEDEWRREERYEHPHQQQRYERGRERERAPPASTSTTTTTLPPLVGSPRASGPSPNQQVPAGFASIMNAYSPAAGP
jgi:hypothetical protein